MFGLRKCIEDTIEGFDFERVHKIMDFLQWKWVGGNVPSVEEMKKHVKELFEDAVFSCFENDEEIYHVCSGGFEVIVERYFNDEEDICFNCKLNFIAEEFEASSEDNVE